MKRALVFLVFSTLISVTYCQKSIDALFAKYADNDGFVTLTISGNLMNLFNLDGKKCHEDHWPGKVSEIRFLVQDDERVRVENFYNAAVSGINKKDYEEYMSIKESDQDIKMFVRGDGETIRELLLIAGGENNFVIQIKGEMTINEVEKFSSEAKKNHCRDLL
jgi:hypothetical protein